MFIKVEIRKGIGGVGVCDKSNKNIVCRDDVGDEIGGHFLQYFILGVVNKDVQKNDRSS